MPVILQGERVPGFPYLLMDGISPTIGWEFQAANGGNCFAIIRRTRLGTLKVAERFPMTEEGWARAWQTLARQNPAAVPGVLARLQAREAETAGMRARGADLRALAEVETKASATMLDMAYLGGYFPEAAITARGLYDLRFLEDRFMIFAARRARVLASVPYSQVEDVEIGGPGLVKSGGGFVGGGFGAAGAVEGMAIAAVLNALTTRTSIKTVLRIQATGCELFLLHARLTPDRLRIELSRPLGAIRSARSAAVPAIIRPGPPGAPRSPVEELAKLADMLEKAC
jgi:hypothetical protein